MRKLNTKIETTKRKLVDICSILDEIYRDIETDVNSERAELKRLQNKSKEISNGVNSDKDRILLKITSRMIYLNKLHTVSKDIVDAKITELSRLLDWIEEM